MMKQVQYSTLALFLLAGFFKPAWAADYTCSAPSKVFIHCDQWNEDIEFDHFDFFDDTTAFQDGRIGSYEISDRAACEGDKLFPFRDYMALEFTTDDLKIANEKCASSINPERVTTLTQKLRTCVDYFVSKCSLKPEIQGHFGEKSSNEKDWWTISTICKNCTQNPEVTDAVKPKKSKKNK